MTHSRSLLVIFYVTITGSSYAMQIDSVEEAQKDSFVAEQTIIRSSSGSLKALVAMRIAAKHHEIIIAALSTMPFECKAALARAYYTHHNYEELKALSSSNTIFARKKDARNTKSSCFTMANYRPTRHPENPFLVTPKDGETVQFGFVYKEKDFDREIPQRLRCPHIPRSQQEERDKFLHYLEDDQFFDYRSPDKTFQMTVGTRPTLCAGPNNNGYMVIAQDHSIDRRTTKKIWKKTLSGSPAYSYYNLDVNSITAFWLPHDVQDTVRAVAISWNRDDIFVTTQSGKTYRAVSSSSYELARGTGHPLYAPMLTKDEKKKYFLRNIKYDEEKLTKLAEKKKEFDARGMGLSDIRDLSLYFNMDLKYEDRYTYSNDVICSWDYEDYVHMLESLPDNYYWKENVSFTLHELPVSVDGPIIDLLVSKDDSFLWILSTQAIHKYNLNTKEQTLVCKIPTIPSDVVIETADGELLVKEDSAPETIVVFAFSHDEKYGLLGGSEGTVLLVDMSHGCSYVLETLPPSPIADMWWNQENKVVILSRSGAVRTFTLELGYTESCPFQ